MKISLIMRMSKMLTDLSAIIHKIIIKNTFESMVYNILVKKEFR